MTVTSTMKKNLLGIFTVGKIQLNEDFLVLFYPWFRAYDHHALRVRRNSKGELRLVNSTHYKESFRMIATHLQYEDRPFPANSDVYAHPAWKLICDCVNAHTGDDKSVFDVYNSRTGLSVTRVDTEEIVRHEVTARISGKFTFEHSGILMPVEVTVCDKKRGVKFDLEFNIKATTYASLYPDTYLLDDTLKYLSLMDFSAVRKAILLSLDNRSWENTIEGDFRYSHDNEQPLEQYEEVMCFCIERMQELTRG